MEDYSNGQSGFISGLDNETVNAMNSAKKNFNDDFLNGASTSGFREYKETGDKTKLASTGENLSGVVNGVAASAQLIDSVITPKLTTYITSYVSNVVMSYMADAMTEMLSFDPSAVVSMAGGLMQQYIIGPSQIMSELLKPRESINDEMLNDVQNKLMDKINEKIGDTVGKVTDEINKKLEGINPAIAEVSYYAQMGPEWMQSKIDLVTKKVVENCLSGIGTARDTVKKQKDDLIKNLAEKEAKRMAEKVNDQVAKTTKEKIDALNKQKQDAMNKVKTQIINVKLKLFALIGA